MLTFEMFDSRLAMRAVEDHIALLGKAPKSYAYDRVGWSEGNVTALKQLGVRAVGLAPVARRREGRR